MENHIRNVRCSCREKNPKNPLRRRQEPFFLCVGRNSVDPVSTDSTDTKLDSGFDSGILFVSDQITVRLLYCFMILLRNTNNKYLRGVTREAEKAASSRSSSESFITRRSRAAERNRLIDIYIHLLYISYRFYGNNLSDTEKFSFYSCYNVRENWTTHSFRTCSTTLHVAMNS